MALAAARVDDLLSGASRIGIGIEQLTRAVQRLADGETLTAGELRVCCAGATTPVTVLGIGTSIQIIDRDDLTERLMSQVSANATSRRASRRFAFGLAHAYLLPGESPAGNRNAETVGAFVLNYARSSSGRERDQRFPELLAAVAEVFRGGSTRQFWPFVLEQDLVAVGPLHRLGVPATSWLWRKIYLDAMVECASWTDARFEEVIDPLVEALLRADSEHHAVLDVCLGLIVKRLAQGDQRGDRQRVRELTIERWGSPLSAAQRPRWHQFANESARAMVAGWLTRRAIGAFFGALAGPHADPRRAAFWSRYAEGIDEMWIFLGDAAWRQATESRAELRRTLGDSLRRLDDDVRNAFVMIIGGYAFVEFSNTGNAAYVYDRDGMPFRLDGPPPRLGGMKEQNLCVDRLVHMGQWEDRAINMVGGMTGVWP